jgi:hypothetical protein
MKRLFLLGLCWLVFTGCAASRQYFQPTERVHGVTVQGYREAIYDLLGPRGRFGEAKLWSRGAYRGPQKRTVVHLAIEIQNTGSDALELRSAEVRLAPVRTDERVIDELSPAETEVLAIPPGAIVLARLHFVLPEGTSPGEVVAFRAHWNVRGPTYGYSQYTPFMEQYRGYGYRYHYYYCDPIDPFCYYPYHYPYGYPAYGYGRVIIAAPPPSPRVFVHPRR